MARKPVPEELVKRSILIGQKITKFREKLNISQKDLAIRLGITQGMVCEYEAGTRRIYADLLTRLCEVLQCDPNQITGFTPEVDDKYDAMLWRLDKVLQLDQSHQTRILALIDAYLGTTGGWRDRDLAKVNNKKSQS